MPDHNCHITYHCVYVTTSLCCSFCVEKDFWLPQCLPFPTVTAVRGARLLHEACCDSEEARDRVPWFLTFSNSGTWAQEWQADELRWHRWLRRLQWWYGFLSLSTTVGTQSLFRTINSCVSAWISIKPSSFIKIQQLLRRTCHVSRTSFPMTSLPRMALVFITLCPVPRQGYDSQAAKAVVCPRSHAWWQPCYQLLLFNF